MHHNTPIIIVDSITSLDIIGQLKSWNRMDYHTNLGLLKIHHAKKVFLIVDCTVNGLFHIIVDIVK